MVITTLSLSRVKCCNFARKEKTMLFIKKHFVHLCFALLLCSTLWSATQVITQGHVFNGDFPLYIRQAQSIQNGDIEQLFGDMQQMIGNSTYQRYSPILYPWGYPLLLYPFVVLFGMSYLAFKIVGLMCLLGAFFFFYFHPILSKKRNRPITLIVLSLIAGNVFYWGFFDCIGSELPYLFFLMFSFWGMNRYYSSSKYSGKYIQFILLGMLLFFTSQIRTEGYFLFLSLIVLQLRKKLLKFNCFLPYISALILWAIFVIFFPSGYVEHLEHFKVMTWSGVFHNIQTFYDYPCQILCIPYSIFNLFFWVAFLLGLYVTCKKYVAEFIYLIATLLLLICWPYDVMRYWLSLFPFCFLFFVEGLRFMCMVWENKAGTWVMYAVVGILLLSVWKTAIKTMISPINIYSCQNPDIEGKEAQEMFSYIRSHTSPGDWVACGESRSMYLYTGRLSCNISGEMEGLSPHVDWYVEFLYRGTYLQYAHGMFRLHKKHFLEVFRNKEFAIYKIQKP